MTPIRYWLCVVLFHAVVLVTLGRAARRWRRSEQCRQSVARWLALLTREAGRVGLVVSFAALVVPPLLNLDSLYWTKLGELSLRLWGQALFTEGVLVGLFLAVRHARAARFVRAFGLAAAAAGLFAVYVRAYLVEPNMLRVRHHVLEPPSATPEARGLRILHLTDIQTPTIGEHERHALVAGLAEHPDLIVLTGDYVQNELGRDTEKQAIADLRGLMARIGFAAPLGVFATNGDAGPPCREVFEGTVVRCLVDESVLVPLPGGGTLSITGLARTRGRERDPAALAALLRAAPRADERIVISHAPDFVDALPEPVDLVLAGHTHGGQVVLPLLGPPRTASRLPRLYAGGLHDFAGTPLHVSRGVGMERGFAPPLRFLCPPEICVLDVHVRGRGSRLVHAGEPRGVTAVW